MRKIYCAGLILAFTTSAFAAPTVYVDDDFESYADTAAMQGVWGAAGLGTLDPTMGLSPTQSMAHPGGTDNTFALGADLIPSNAQPVVLRGAIFDDGAGNKRFSIGFRSLATFPLFEMGMYNSVLNENYFSRITLFPGANPSWIPMPGLTSMAPAGWHTWEATFTGTDITVTLDLMSDSTIDSTQITALGGAYGADGLGVVRLGGPSNLSSPGGGGNFDDIHLAQIPEPASLTLLALGGLAVLRRRR